MFDRSRLEELNADHHRRMAQMPSRGSNDTRDSQSRSKLIAAVHGCISRHRMALLPGEQFRVLELGAGYAGDRPTLITEFGAHYTGIEAVKHVAEAASANLPSGEPILHMAIEELPPEWEGRFHLVYSRHVMEHVLDVDLALSNIKRALAPNGIVASVTPHYFPDPEPAHVTQLRIEEWLHAYKRVGLTSVYATIEHFACEEAHILAVRDTWELQP